MPVPGESQLLCALPVFCKDSPGTCHQQLAFKYVKNCEKYDGPSTKTTFTILDENKDKFSTLKTALDAAGITQETINGLEPIIIFAPTNDAFNKLPSGLLDELLKPENKENLTDILNNHIIKNQKIDLPEGMSTFGI